MIKRELLTRRIKIMVLQKILWPTDGICLEEDLYFHKVKKAYCVVGEASQYVVMNKKANIAMDTYFNGFSIEKWCKYTVVDKVKLSLSLEGTMNVRLFSVQKINDTFKRKLLSKKTVMCEQREDHIFEFEKTNKGILYFQLESLAKGGRFYGGYYFTDIPDSKVKDVKIGIDICTFKREEYILKNIGLLNQHLIYNKESILYNNLEVYISDNGKTLPMDEINSDYIHIVQNKNTGGAGGFTRGMIEMRNSGKKYTHVLLMDDDVIIDPNSIERTATVLALLKEEYKEAFIGGAMLRSDQQYVQVESGASWNAGKLVSLKGNMDMRRWEDCLFNEIEEYTEFNAWWYCCIPFNVIREDNLPLPLFIRGDDVEFGLRNMKTMILMNGICVWHEPFENKYSSFLEYYIIRNKLIDNACHFPSWGKKQLISDLKDEYRREGYLYRYKNIDLYIRGVRDFLKGIEWLEGQDGEQLHKEIMASGYKAVPVEHLDTPFDYGQYERGLCEEHSKFHELVRKMSMNGYLLPAKHTRIVPMANPRVKFVWRAKKILYYDPVEKKGFITERSLKTFWKQKLEVRKLIKEINRDYDAAAEDYRSRISEIRSESYWKKYLGM
jgi:GT2 family glycosyltransferase